MYEWPKEEHHIWLSGKSIQDEGTANAKGQQKRPERMGWGKLGKRCKKKKKSKVGEVASPRSGVDLAMEDVLKIWQKDSRGLVVSQIVVKTSFTFLHVTIVAVFGINYTERTSVEQGSLLRAVCKNPGVRWWWRGWWAERVVTSDQSVDVSAGRADTSVWWKEFKEWQEREARGYSQELRWKGKTHFVGKIKELKFWTW